MTAATILSVIVLMGAAPPDDSQPLPTVAAVSSSSHVDPRLSTAVSRLAGHAVSVRCLSDADWLALADAVRAYNGANIADGGGRTSSDDQRVSLAPEVCRLAARLAYSTYWPAANRDRSRLAQAIEIVAHESQHAAGHPEEYVAECYGEQLTAPLAKLLRPKMKLVNARLLARLTWTIRYPQLPQSYRSPDCQDGGSLDLNPTSSVWP